jgi:transposase
LLLEGPGEHLQRLSHLWVDAGYQGRGKEWVEKELSLSVEVVHRTPKLLLKSSQDLGRGMVQGGLAHRLAETAPRRGFEVLPRRWVVERTFAWLSQNRRMSKTTRGCARAAIFRICGNGSPHGEAVSLRLGLFGQSQRRSSGKLASGTGRSREVSRRRA